MPGSLQRQVSPGFIPLSWQMFLKLSEKNPKTMMSSFFTTNESQTCPCIQINICFSVAKQPDSSKISLVSYSSIPLCIKTFPQESISISVVGLAYQDQDNSSCIQYHHDHICLLDEARRTGVV